MAVRLEAARARLAAHHSAPFGGMRRGGGGGGNGGRNGGGGFAGVPGGDLQAARQLFFSLFGGGRQEGGQRGSGGGGGSGVARRGGGGGRIREGEWQCRCGFANRPHRVQCYACGRERQAGAGQPAPAGKGAGTSMAARAKGAGGWADGKGRSLEGEGRRWDGGGPVGADGKRPLLGTFGAAKTSSAPGGPGAAGVKGQCKGTVGGKSNGGDGKGPGQGLASDSSGVRGAGSGSGAKGAGEAREASARPKGVWAKPPCQVDADGYTLVQPRRRWQQEGTAGKGAEEGKPMPCPAPQAASRPRWSEEQSDDEMYAEDDLAADDQDGHEEDAGNNDDPRRLRTRYEALARAVREWEKRTPGEQNDPALITLREARDGAEEDWRRVKNPAPLPTRMGRAQVKLDKAEAALTRARLAVDSFDEWADAQRADLLRQVDEADRWYRWRQQQMEELHDEAGAKTSCRATNGGRDLERSAAVSERLVGELLPEVQALLEHVQGNPEIEERLASIAAGLQSAGHELGSAQAGAAERFDIGTGDAWDAWDQQWDDGCEHAADDTQMGDAADDRDGRAKGGTVGWRPEGAGRWSKASTGQEGTAPATELRNGKGANYANNSGGGGPTAAAGSIDAAPTSTGNGNKRGAEEPVDAKGAVRQKTDAEAREEADRRRAAELQQQQQQAIAAQQASHEAGAGGFGSETAQSVAAQHFVAEVCKAVERARKVGVVPRAEGKELVELTPYGA